MRSVAPSVRVVGRILFYPVQRCVNGAVLQGGIAFFAWRRYQEGSTTSFAPSYEQEFGVGGVGGVVGAPGGGADYGYGGAPGGKPAGELYFCLPPFFQFVSVQLTKLDVISSSTFD